MAKSGITAGSADAKRLYEEKLYRRNVADSYFSRFMGDTFKSMVFVKREMEKSRGDTVYFGYVADLSGDGVTGGQTLEGNEEKMSNYTYNLTLERYRHAVRDDGQLSRQRPFWDLTKEQKALIEEWGSTKIDKLLFAAQEAAYSDVLYLNSSGVFTHTQTEATAKAGLDATNSKISLDFITQCRTWAETGGAETITPLRPLKVDGDDYYILLCYPDVLADLLMIDEFKQARRDAMERGRTNPLFKNAVAVWDNVIIHAHRRKHKGTDGGGGAVAWAKCDLLGQGALALAWGERPSLVEKKFDYEEEFGVAWRMTMKAGKPQFNSRDYGSIGVFVSRTKISDV